MKEDFVMAKWDKDISIHKEECKKFLEKWSRKRLYEDESFYRQLVVELCLSHQLLRIFVRRSTRIPLLCVFAENLFFSPLLIINSKYLINGSTLQFFFPYLNFIISFFLIDLFYCNIFIIF